MTPFKRLVCYAKHYWRYLILSGCMTICFGIFSALPAYLIRIIIDSIIAPRATAMLAPFIACLGGIFLCKGIFIYLSSYYLEYVSNRIMRDVREDLFGALLNLPASSFKQTSSGELLSLFIADITALQEASNRAIRLGIRSVVEAIFLLGIAIAQNTTLALIMLVVGPTIGGAMRILGKKMRTSARLGQEHIGSLASYLQQVIIGIRDIFACNAQAYEQERFKHILQTHLAIIMRTAHIAALTPALIECIAMLGVVVVLYIALNQVLSGTISSGQLGAFFAAMMLAYQPVKRLVNIYADLQMGIAAATRIFDLIDRAQENSLTTLPEVSLTTPLSHISFKHVSFCYQQKAPILKDLCFTINAGDRIGIMGASGSGKSTLCDLLLKFINPSSGTLLFNNEPLASFSTMNLRMQIGYVGQRTFLFNDTVAKNIAYSYKHASPDEIIYAAKQASAHEFIMQLPYGYETLVGEDGSLLSGGQKQRLTIARALLKKPQLLILDEATSALDAATAQDIMGTIGALPAQMTIITITHDEAILRHMHRILKLEHGMLIESSANQLFPSQDQNYDRTRP